MACTAARPRGRGPRGARSPRTVRGSRWSSTITRTMSGGTSSKAAAASTQTRDREAPRRARAAGGSSHGRRDRAARGDSAGDGVTLIDALRQRRRSACELGAEDAGVEPAAAISSACVPSSSIRPSCRTTTRSACGNAARRCEHSDDGHAALGGAGRRRTPRFSAADDARPRWRRRRPRTGRRGRAAPAAGRARGDRARQADPLALAAREPEPELADLGVEPARKAEHVLVQRRQPQRLRQDGSSRGAARRGPAPRCRGREPENRSGSCGR